MTNTTALNQIEIKAGITEVIYNAENEIDNVSKPIKLNHKNNVNIKSFNQLAREGENLPELKQLFGNFILENNVVLFPSERGCGKTFLSLQIAIAVAEGYTEILDEKIDLHGNTLYINMELGERIMSKRLYKLYETVVHKPGNPYKAYCITERKNFSVIQHEVEERISEIKPVLVVIDNLRTLFSESNNEKNGEMTKSITMLNKLRDKYGFALLLVHHTKKNSGFQKTNSDLQSGAGAITDLVDADFFLRRSTQDSSYRLLKRVKSRNCEEMDEAKLLRFNPETLWFEVVEENVNEMAHIFQQNSGSSDSVNQKEIAIQLRAAGNSMDAIGQQLGVNKSTISRWLKNISN